MRRLNEEYARRGRTFSDADLRGVIAGLAPHWNGLEAFFRDDVSGTRELDYETYLGFAGLRLVRTVEERPSLGFLPVRSFDRPVEVESVEPNSHAQKAGVRRGDIVMKLNGKRLSGFLESQIAGMKPGQTIKLELSRHGRHVEVEYALESIQEESDRVEEDKHATPEQLRVREGWLAGTTSADGTGMR